MKKYLVEFIGTFFLTLAVCMNVAAGNALAAIGIGFTLMVMIFAGGHISGGHYNPAVTLGVWLRGKCASADMPGYLIGQIAGAAVAAMTAKFLGALPPVAAAGAATFTTTQIMLAEFMFTFALVYVVLNVATAKGTNGNSFYGFAIGSTVVVGALAVGGISGGVFNPAVFVGIALFGLKSFGEIATFWAAELVAGAAAAFVFIFCNPDDK